MKWLVAEAPVVIVLRNILSVILHLNRFDLISRNGQENFNTEFPTISFGDLMNP